MIKKIGVISDTHGQHRRVKIPAGLDILVHAGDFSNRGGEQALASFLDWFGEQDVKNKIFIAGNHDIGMRRRGSDWYVKLLFDAAKNGVTYLQDNTAVIQGIHFYGSPWVPYIGGWEFELDKLDRYQGYSDARSKWSKIPASTDVLITHCPPQSILSGPGQNFWGCSELARRVFEIGPKAHLFGHIHEDAGRKEIQGIEFINASQINRLNDDIFILELEVE